MPSTRTLLSLAILGGSIALAGAAVAAPPAKPSKADARFIVHLHKGKSAEARRALQSAGATVKRVLPAHDAVAVEADPSAVRALRALPGVKRIERDAKRYPMAVRSRPSGADAGPADHGPAGQTAPYGIAMVQADQLEGDPTAGIRTCVIDSGYDLGHEDLPGEDLVTGSDDLPGTGPWSEDGDGHGTHVAGTIAALDNGLGVVGVFPGAPLHIVRVFGDDGLWAYSSDLVAALDECRAAGAKVVNMSLGADKPTALENMAFRKAEKAGVLSIAASGNDGNRRMSYPAAYHSVVSVGAVDSTAELAPFSQRNTKVQFAAPGVSVLSTVPTGSMLDVVLTSALGDTDVEPMDNFPIPADPVTGDLVDCGLGTTPADCGDATGAVCLIERGAVTFAQKALSCEAAGGVAAVVFNREGEAGPVYGTLGETSVGIPVVGTDRDTGLALRTDHLGSSATLSFTPAHYDYDYYSGTSMATPHVAGVAALVWSLHPACTNHEIRDALRATAVDLGVPGEDHSYGYGLVQARAASEWLDANGCAAQ